MFFSNWNKEPDEEKIYRWTEFFHKLGNSKWKMHTGARARKQKYISIYISLSMKTFLKTGVYIYLTLKNFTSYISQVVPTYAGVPPLFLQCWQELILDLLFSDSFFRYQEGTYYFDNCSSSSIKVDTAIIRNNSRLNGYSNCICFSVKKENQHSSLLGRNCNKKLGYICEQSRLKKSNLLFKQVLANSL